MYMYLEDMTQAGLEINKKNRYILNICMYILRLVVVIAARIYQSTQQYL